MLKQLGFLKTEYKSLETKLVAELKRKSPNKSRIQQLRKLKRRIKTTMLILLTRKSIARKMRSRRRAKRRNRVPYTYPTKRYNFTF